MRFFGSSKKSFQYDTNILDRGSQVVDFERMSLEGSNKLIRGLSTMYRLPSRFLMAEDAFFKQLNFRAFAKAEIWKKVQGQGKQVCSLKSLWIEDLSR